MRDELHSMGWWLRLPAPGSHADGPSVDLRERIWAAVEGLRPLQRDTLRAVYWDGKTRSQIARERGVSREAVRRCLNRAVNNVGRQLGVRP